MPKPVDFTGFSYLFMINFLSTCGKIEVSTPSHSHKWRRKFMPVKYKYRQISLKDAFSDCQDMFVDDAPSFFQLLNEHFDIQEFIPSVFRNAFYQHFGRKRDYPLEGFLSALILQKIFSIPSDSLLLLFLRLSRELRDFCGFSKVPDAPLLTRFKQNFDYEPLFS